jgi:hypothetical protein
MQDFVFVCFLILAESKATLHLNTIQVIYVFSFLKKHLI